MVKDYPADHTLTAPEPLFRPCAEGVPLPLAHLAPPRAPTQALADQTQAPIEIGFQSLRVVSSLATQSLADVETLAGKALLSLFFLTVAPYGERKSSCVKLAMEPVQIWE